MQDTIITRFENTRTSPEQTQTHHEQIIAIIIINYKFNFFAPYL